MWFFMYSCYGLSIVTLALLGTAFLQNCLHFDVGRANEVTFMILVSIVYLFTETLVIFFFVGTGVSVKEYTLEHGLAPDYHRRSIAIKHRVYPPLLLNILLLMILFVLIGAVDTGRMPGWLYEGYFVFCLAHFLYAKAVQHGAFRDNTANILAMVGISR